MRYWYMDIKVDEHTVIVFDLDDTLYNEIDFLRSAYRDIAKYLEPVQWKRLYVLMFSLYRDKQDVFEVLAAKYNMDKKNLIMRYREHEPDIKLFPDVMEKLTQIRDKNGFIAIVTDGRKKTQMLKIKALGISKIVDRVVISEEVGSEKPSIANFKIIEDEFKKSTYYYIADNLGKDFVTPNARGWKTIGLIDNGLNIHNNAYKHNKEQYIPHNFVSSFNEISIR
ncbi:HAD family hydrolase [Spongiimicrobium sp. 2-473A-2-J]|uniref:HAD family hydrolase n=1 Tax=Eudoraea algarum TaxID=3417568 RepID=UPI003D36B66F